MQNYNNQNHPDYNPQIQNQYLPQNNYMYPYNNTPQNNRYQQPVYYNQQPFRPYYVKPIDLQQNGIPVKPLPEEKSFIKNKYNWTAGMLLLCALCVIILTIVLSFVTSGIESTAREELVVMLSYMFANLMTAFIGCKITKINLKQFFNLEKVSGKFLTSSVFTSLGIHSLCILIVSFLTGLLATFSIDITGNASEHELSDAAQIILLIYSCVIAPVTEEILFRGFVFKNLSRFNLTFGIIASALMFGLFHGNIAQFLIATVLGIFFAYIDAKANSIIPSIICHMAANTFLSILDLVQNVVPTDTYGNITLIAFIVMSIIGGILIIISTIRKDFDIPAQTISQKNRGFALFFSSCNVIIFLIYCLINVCLSISIN